MWRQKSPIIPNSYQENWYRIFIMLESIFSVLADTNYFYITFIFVHPQRTSLLSQMVKHLPTVRKTRFQSLGWEDVLEKEMAIHSNILAWKIPWTEEPGRLQSMGSQRVGHDWATSLNQTLSVYRDSTAHVQDGNPCFQDDHRTKNLQSREPKQ